MLRRQRPHDERSKLTLAVLCHVCCRCRNKTYMQTRRPKRFGVALTLDFGNRVHESSIRNIQLELVVHGRPVRVLQFGKDSPRAYALDFMEGVVSVEQAFAIAIAQLET